MAIGLALMFGLRLPFNFNAPYRAVSVRDFWRRWHMTLSRFLRDYLYIPLGGNRGTAARQAVNVVATMLLGGLWHGANWTFVAWGGLHGRALAVNHVWAARGFRLPRPAAWLLTLLFVMACWVLFRPPDFGRCRPNPRQHGRRARARARQARPRIRHRPDRRRRWSRRWARPARTPLCAGCGLKPGWRFPPAHCWPICCF